eukprot:2394097-Alexandrium_andersonii.AAC.1
MQLQTLQGGLVPPLALWAGACRRDAVRAEAGLRQELLDEDVEALLVDLCRCLVRWGRPPEFRSPGAALLS